MRKFIIYDLVIVACSILLLFAIPFVMSEAEVGSTMIMYARVCVILWTVGYVAYVFYPGKKMYSCPICSMDFDKNELVKKKVGFMTANNLCPYCIKEREVPCVPYYPRED